MRLPVRQAARLAVLIALPLAGSLAAASREPIPEERTGPAADYPVVVGDPFKIGDKVWVPVDQLNYDAVGLASIGGADLAGISAAHKTLPLPSYVEVTALGSGKTILVRVERRGPMANDLLVELSPAAAAQLGLSAGAPAAVRVRRVNPPEPERALLRQGREAPMRMETPEGLLRVLRKNLTDTPKMLAAAGPAPRPPIEATGPVGTAGNMPIAQARPAQAPVVSQPAAPQAPQPQAEKAKPTQAAPATSQKAPAAGSLVVQVGAFSVESGARTLARKLGASVEHPGKFWLVRMGPFDSRAKAEAALEKARRAGYSDARIQSVN